MPILSGAWTAALLLPLARGCLPGADPAGPRGRHFIENRRYDVRQRQLRGNLPQAFVHAQLLETAVRLGGEQGG